MVNVGVRRTKNGRKVVSVERNSESTPRLQAEGKVDPIQWNGNHNGNGNGTQTQIETGF